MSINVDLDYLLKQLPEVLSWIVPGLLFVFTYRRFKYEERCNESDSISLIKAIGISFFVRYAVIIVLSWIPGNWLFGLDGSVWVAICSCLVGVVLGGLFGWVSNLTITKEASEKYLHLTINSNPLFDLADKENGCYARIYLNQIKDEYVFGIYSNCYNRGSEDWLVVMNAIRIKGILDEKLEKEYKEREDKETSKLLINMRDVMMLEYVYTENLVSD